MAKPSVTSVEEWEVVYDSEIVKVEVGSAEFPDDYWKVSPVGQKPKYFYGESAWSDARRMAADLDFQAWSIA